jgi:hypothetical protein
VLQQASVGFDSSYPAALDRNSRGSAGIGIAATPRLERHACGAP